MVKMLMASLVMFAMSAHAAETYKIDAKESTIEWKGSKKLGSSHHGGVSFKEGTVSVDKGALVGGQATVDMKTITNEDVEGEWKAKLVGHLSSGDFFDVAKYPTSTFKITSVTMKSPTEALVKGDFTMIGKTNPVEFPMQVSIDKGTATGTGTLKVNRTKWGLKYGSGSIFKELAADKIISDDFELKLKIVAKK